MFNITIPRTDKNIKMTEGQILTYVDLPGIDDANWHIRINRFI